MVARAREIHGARSLVGPAGTRTMAADRPGRRSALSAPGTPCRRARFRRHRLTPGLIPSFHSPGWGVRTAEVRYQTRRCWSETSPQMLQGQRQVDLIMQHSRATQGRRLAPTRACPGGSNTPAWRMDRWIQSRGRTVPMAARWGWWDKSHHHPPNGPILPTTSASNDRFVGPAQCNFGARRAGGSYGSGLSPGGAAACF